MILSEMRSDAIMNSSGLGLRNIDQNYDWADDVRWCYPDINLADTFNFIQQACEVSIVNDKNATNRAVNYQTLNANQMRIFKRIKSHYKTLITNLGNIEPLRLIVIGIARMRKSYLINMIRDCL